MTIVMRHALAFVLVCLALGSVLMAASSLPVQATSHAVIAPTGWHVLYNESNRKCLNLVTGKVLQKCNSGDENQQYAAILNSDGTVKIFNRASAACLVVTQQFTGGVGGPLQFVQQSCNSTVGGPLGLVVSTDWTLQKVGTSTVDRLHLLSSGGVALGIGGPGLTLGSPGSSNNLTQIWQFR